LCRAYEATAARHNASGLTQPLDPAVRLFHDRPFLILDAGRFATALRSTITDPALRALPPIGAVDQIVDNTDVLERPSLLRAACPRGTAPWLGSVGDCRLWSVASGTSRNAS
jgi:hypothetical protein